MKGVCQSQRRVAVQFGAVKSTVGYIHTNRCAILKDWEETHSNIKKQQLQRRGNENVNTVRQQFSLKCHGMNILVTGQILQTKVREVAHRLHVGSFQISNGGFELFRT
jgi:hypothetical protein